MATSLMCSGGTPLPSPRQIRFVNNQCLPPTKRRRVNAACLNCRKRKTRCSGEQPTCSTCEKNGHECPGYSEGSDKKKHGGSNGGDFDGDQEQVYSDEEQAELRWHKSRSSSKASIKTENMNDAPRQQSGTCLTTRPGKADSSGWDEQGGGDVRWLPRLQATRDYADGELSSPSCLRSPLAHQSGHRRAFSSRYFGPSAIVPGFTQVDIKARQRRREALPAASASSITVFSGEGDVQQADDMPLYDPLDDKPVSPIILGLVDIFFVNLGCNYPFLHRDRFPTAVKEKRAEPILVDAVCALAARFTESAGATKGEKVKLARSNYGLVLAERAKAATVETFACPSVAAVQACLLLAYEGFGADQDSALWMYLGLAIRMAIDLGLNKREGDVMRGDKDSLHRYRQNGSKTRSENGDSFIEASGQLGPEEQEELEAERVSTLWSVFVLDRIVSSGTGRPVTLKDEDVEVDFPQPAVDAVTGLPDPFPTLIRVMHLYGRVSDILNKVKAPQNLTAERRMMLMDMKSELTTLHQGQDSPLHFDVGNFKLYADANQGTTFVQLHFWFHALIIVLHQPTLLAALPESDGVADLVARSRELSRSSAKTIAEILALSKLLGPQSLVASPFSSQPIYIAACAFMAETATSLSEDVAGSQQQHQRQRQSPDPSRRDSPLSGAAANPSNGLATGPSPHSLLTSAAHDNFRSCYEALQQMHSFWGGVRYIIASLDSKADGIWDCETYARQEKERSKSGSTGPGRGSGSSVWSVPLGGEKQQMSLPMAASPAVPPMGWSLSGISQVSNPNPTTLMYPPDSFPYQAGVSTVPTAQGSHNMTYDSLRQQQKGAEARSMCPPGYVQQQQATPRHPPTKSRRPLQVSIPCLPVYNSIATPGDEILQTPASPEFQPHYVVSPPLSSTLTMPAMAYTPTSQISGFDASSYAVCISPSSSSSPSRNPSLGDSGSGSGTTHCTPRLGQYQMSAAPSPSATFAQQPRQNSNGGGCVDLAAAAPSSTEYSYLGPPEQSFNVDTFHGGTDMGQLVSGFENSDTMNWFGAYFPNDLLGMYDAGGNPATLSG